MLGSSLRLGIGDEGFVSRPVGFEFINIDHDGWTMGCLEGIRWRQLAYYLIPRPPSGGTSSSSSLHGPQLDVSSVKFNGEVAPYGVMHLSARRKVWAAAAVICIKSTYPSSTLRGKVKFQAIAAIVRWVLSDVIC